jgi:hypothetical protein
MNKENIKLYPPHIYLFAFYQKDKSTSLTASDGDSGDWLWNQCDNIINKTSLKQSNEFKLKLLFEEEDDNITHIPLAKYHQDENHKSDEIYVPYLELISSKQKDNRIYFHPDFENKNYDYDDFIYPVKSYDCYGIGLRIRHPTARYGNKINAKAIELFNKDNCFIFQENEKFIGQTLIIRVPLPPDEKKQSTEVLKQIADNYIWALFPDDSSHDSSLGTPIYKYRTPPFNQGGKLFDNSPIFEYGIFRQLTTYRHILVWFLSDEDKFNLCYKELFDLFCFRAEVVNAYQKSCNKDKKSAIAVYQQIKDKIKSMVEKSETLGLNQNELKEFNGQLISLLRMSLDYADKLRVLEDNHNKIVVKNRYYAEKIKEIKSIIPHENISFLENFHRKTCDYFEGQVTTEIDYFRHGFGLIDKAIASIRGQVAIDLAEAERQRNRNEQRFQLAIGTGFTVAGIVATARQNHSQPGNLFAESIGAGVSVTIIIWLISLAIARLRERRKFQTSRQEKTLDK